MAIIWILGIIAFLVMVHPVIFGILAALLAIILVIAIVLGWNGSPTSYSSSGGRQYHRRYYRSRRSSKSFLKVMLDGQARTQRRNGSHRGVMCGPGGSRRRKKSSWL